MSFKLSLVLVLLAVAVSSHVPGVHSCVQFRANLGDIPRSPTTIVGYLVDNPGEVCSFFGPVGSDGLYTFTCNAGFSTVLNPSDGNVQYSTPDGSFPFPTTFTPNVGWQACVFGCSSCWMILSAPIDHSVIDLISESSFSFFVVFNIFRDMTFRLLLTCVVKYILRLIPMHVANWCLTF